MPEDERLSHIKELQRRADDVAGADIESMVRSDLETDLRFELYRGEFEMARVLAQRVRASDLDALPNSVVLEGVTAFDRLITGLGGLQSFSVRKVAEEGRNVTDARNKAANAFLERYQEFLKGLTSVFAFAAAASSVEQAGRSRVAMKGLEDESRTAAAQIRERLTDITRLEELAREAVQKVGIAAHAIHFENEAKLHEAAAKKWLQILAGLAGSLVVLTGVNLYVAFATAPPATGVEATTLVIAKLFVFTVLVSATLWAGRVYRASKHNAVVNRHRQNSLSSFETFAKSADDATRNVVLLQATQSIFAPQHSGFGSTDADPSIASPVVELLRSASSASK